jgi:hypothetical protein
MPHRRLLVLIAATASLLLGAGCRELDNPTSPGSSGNSQPAGLIQNVDDVTADAWQLVTTTLVLPGLRTEVKGSRYTLTFQPLSLVTSLNVTIRERDAGIVDVELGPDGSAFFKSVTLDIDYRGTEFDRSLPGYSGREPKLFWFNPSTRNWVLVPGTDDPKQSVYSVKLQHFSRYAMGEGTSGWEDAQGDREKDSVK